MGQCSGLPIKRRRKSVDNKTAKSDVKEDDGSEIRIRRNLIIDDYEILSDVLGIGISGKVRCAKRRIDGRKFALKVLRNVPAALREIQLQHICRHIHVVGIIDVYDNTYDEQSCLFVVLELMAGGALFDRIKRGPITEREAAYIMRDIGTAVAHLHSFNIAHRDIKPENVLYTEDGVLKLADFGFAKQNNEGDDRPLKTACYTHYYVPPEILQRVHYDKSCDMWSLGVVMYILLCGFPPFYSEGGRDFSAGMQRRIRSGNYSFPSPEWNKVSREAKDLVSKLIVTDPNCRLTIEEMMQHEWISQCSLVPKTPLYNPSQIADEQIEEMQEAMGKELTGMRMANDDLHIKPLAESNNRILTRRKIMKMNANGMHVEKGS